MSWRDYAHILLERFWILATVLVAVMVFAVLSLNRRTPLYRASARIQMDVQQPKALSPGELLDVSTRDFAYIHTQIRLLESRMMADKAAAHLSESLPAQVDGAALRGAVRVESVPNTRMVDVVATHAKPDMAALLANGLAETYVQENLNQRMEASMEAVRWLTTQADKHRASLRESEEALQEFKEKQLASVRADEKNLVLTKLQELGVSLMEAETRLQALEAEWRNIEERRKTGAPVFDIASIAAFPDVASTRAQLLQKDTDIALLRKRYLDKMPEMQQAVNELAGINAQLERACESAVARIRSQVQEARDREANLRRAFDLQQKLAFDLERKLMAYEELARNVEADRALYNSVLARMKETTVTGQVETNNVRLVDRALPPTGPFNIQSRRELLQAAVLGLCLGIGLCFLVHFADDRIRRTDDVERLLRLPVLAMVPRIRGTRPSERARVANVDRHSLAAESFRTLRASMALSPAAKKARQLMVTSAGAGAGKSLVAANLSIVLAQNGLRTLLVDGDLRRPSLHTAFGLDREKGLSHVLAGEMEWKDAVVPSDVEGLDLLPVGVPPPNPAELLGSGAMAQLLEDTGRVYDKVILDCPPLFGLADPLVLMPQVHAVIFVVRFNSSSYRAVREALKKLRGGDTPVVGAVMNCVDTRRPSGYYYYYHYGHYHDRKGQGRRKKG
jgi:capsular exopolysaccharide synthesis family protein